MQISSMRDQRSAGLTLGVPATTAAAASLRAETPFALSGRLTAFDGVSYESRLSRVRARARVFPRRLSRFKMDFRGVSEFFRVINFQNRTWKSHTLVHGFTPPPRGLCHSMIFEGLISKISL